MVVNNMMLTDYVIMFVASDWVWRAGHSTAALLCMVVRNTMFTDYDIMFTDYDIVFTDYDIMFTDYDIIYVVSDWVWRAGHSSAALPGCRWRGVHVLLAVPRR
jgi:hypothetical protein